jgi:hypothetical protein
MNNFLSQLLARSSGSAKVVRPRLASRFEPRSPETFADPHTSPEVPRIEESIDVERLEAESQRNTPEANSSKPGIESHGSRMVSRPTRAQEQHAIGFSRGDDPPPINANSDTAPTQNGNSPILSDKTHFLDNRVRPTLQDIPYAQNDVSAKPASHFESHPETTTTAPALLPTEKSVFQQSLLARNPFATVQLTKQPVVEPVFPTQKTSLLPAQTLTPLPPNAWAPQVVQASSSSATSDPDVHITIGRVEVRAVVTEKPKRTAKAESPVMALDEYLRKQRTGGF